MNESIIRDALKIIFKWKKNREILIIKLKQIISKLNKVQRNVDISRLTGSSTAVVGSTLTVVGVILAPFTFGTSLGLTIAGGTLSIAGTLTSAGSHLVNFCISKSELKLAQNLLNEDVRLLIEIQNALKDEEITSELIGFLTLTGSNLNKIIGAFQMTTALTNTAEDIASLSASFVKKLAISLPKILSRLTIVFNLFGTLFNLIEIVHTSKSVSNGSKSECAKDLENVTNKMQDDLKCFYFVLF